VEPGGRRGRNARDAQLARDIEISLPRELGQAEAIRLAQDFVREQFVARGMVADFNVHWTRASNGGREATLAGEREKLARGVETLELGLRASVRSAVAQSLSGAATSGVEAVQVATQPLLGELAGVTEQAGQAETALRGVVRWASWWLLGWMVAAIGALVLLGWLASTAVLWWDTGAIAAARATKAQLAAEVAQIQANRDDWAKRGMLGKLERCGPKARPCIRVDEGVGTFGERADYRVILGY